MIRKTVHYSGRVQGVGFRYSTCQIAVGHDVTGYVKNLPDGRVELVVEGLSKDVTRFLTTVAAELSLHIRGAEAAESPGTGEFSGFDVRF
ncbi:MAG: acylphosphatase [Planctomycetes bacterium]|nr:acylphosphatase [Planctomycetota bacterium]